MCIFLTVIVSCFMTISLIFILNATLISTIMCLADRINHHISLLHKRSFCLHCGHMLLWYDTIPIISVIMLKGKCRYCQQYFGCHIAIFECLGTIIGTLLFSNPPLWITGLFLLFFSLEDWHDKSIHAYLLIPWLVYLIIHVHDKQHLLMTFSILSISLWLVFIRRAMGSGDIPVLLNLALINDLNGFALTLFVTSILALIYLTIKRTHELPFVPFLFIGWLIVILSQKAIILISG
ncbi:Prepilin peptidase (modular protein) [Leuconostoc carnosum]|nr:Prepilin peptidase (modular protein) [Leuconostoc carnosum]SPO34131.1 Prepilin peptidase (modular protein) [Leuconostoc carnosum]